MKTIRLEPVSGDDAGLKAALMAAGLPTDDILDEGRLFFKAVAEHGATLGYSGLEACGDAYLLRSLAVLPNHRDKGLGRILTQLTLREVADGVDIYLATTTASGFFEALGFDVVERSAVPASILSTRQLSGLCPASATVMTMRGHQPDHVTRP